MNLFYRKPCLAQHEHVEALFAENLSAHERAAKAAQDVAQSSDRNRSKLQQLRAVIAHKSEHETQDRPHPPTSDVRRLVEEALSRPSLNGLPPTRDKS